MTNNSNGVNNLQVFNRSFQFFETTKANSIKHIYLTIHGGRQSFSTENIMRFEACSNYTYIYIENYDKPILTSRTLKFYVDLLKEENFIRLHKKHHVNLKYVTSFTNGNTLNLTDGTSIIVARRRIGFVKQILTNRLFK